MKKGFIFTPDALLGIAIMIALLSAAAIVLQTQPKSTEKTLMDLNTSDTALKNFYTGSSAIDNPTGERINCSTVYEYTNGASGTPGVKVKKCFKLT